MSIISLECINNLLKNTKIEKTKNNGNETIISTTNTSNTVVILRENGDLEYTGSNIPLFSPTLSVVSINLITGKVLNYILH